jgi:hypothetical protein
MRAKHPEITVRFDGAGNDFRIIDHVTKALRMPGFCDEAMSGDDRDLLRICGPWVTLVARFWKASEFVRLGAGYTPSCGDAIAARALPNHAPTGDSFCRSMAACLGLLCGGFDRPSISQLTSQLDQDCGAQNSQNSNHILGATARPLDCRDKRVQIDG